MVFSLPKTNLNSIVKATSYVIPSPLAPATRNFKVTSSIPVDPGTSPLSSTRIVKVLPVGIGAPRAVSGVLTRAQFRLVHNDFSAPNYDNLRRSSTLNAEVATKENRDARKAFTYMVSAAAFGGVGIMGKTAITKTAKFFGFNQDSLALGTVEMDLSKVAEGRSVTMSWQGKPIFIKHRTPDEIEVAQNTPMSDLRDPQEDSARVQRPEWLIAIGVCTHLGCIPVAGRGDFFGGYFCPCHGSHYDASGRIRKGPAPENLAIPPYRFIDDKTIVVG